MRCEDARARLDATRYGDDGPDTGEAEAREHVEGCAECQAHVARAESLDRMLALDEAGPPGPGFDTRFFARLEQERSASRRRGLWRWAWALVPVGVAAGIALMRAPTPAPPEDPGAPPAEIPQGDIALVLELELVEEMAVVEKLDEVEAFELFEGVDDAQLDAILQEVE